MKVPRNSSTRAPESAVQQAVARLYAAHGCRVCNLSQARATRQSEGLPDLYVFPPRGTDLRPWWHETKAEGGKLRPAQVLFAAACNLSGVTVVVGGLADAEQYLAERRLLGTFHEPVPAGEFGTLFNPFASTKKRQRSVRR